MKLQKLLVLTVALSCLTGSQKAHAAEDVGRFAKRALLLSAPFLVRTIINKNVIKTNRYGYVRDVITGVVAAVCWPEALR